MRKKFFYVANVRLPTEKAHGIQIMEMCQAFAGLGLDVELWVPNRHNPLQKDPFEYHDVKKTFRIRRLPCIDVVRFGRLGFLIELLSFGLSVGFCSIGKSEFFFTRDESLAAALKCLGKNVAWEAHMGHKNIFVSAVLRTGIPIVTISQGLKDLYIAMGARDSSVFVAPDGADIDRFNISMSQARAREELNLPQDKKIILHKGHLYDYVGAPDLARAMSHVRHHDALCVFIGGNKEDVEKFKQDFGGKDNILILGNRPRPETPVYQKAADILVIANSAKFERTNLYASPLKLFGYMASGVPIIASDLPALREVLDESIAVFSSPDDPASLARAIDLVLDNYEESLKKASKALVLAESHTWKKRAESVLSFIKA